MKTLMLPAACTALALALTPSGARTAAGTRRPFTLDDEMKLRAIVDARISPDGEQIAYVVSTPSLVKNEHEGALYVVTSEGGTPVRVGETLHIFNTPMPAPRLRCAPDSSQVALLAFSGERPQVFAVPRGGGAPRALTEAPEGVFGFEWSPDGKSLAYLTRDPMSAEEARQRQDKSFVIHADAPERPARINVRGIDGGAARILTPPSQYVDSLSWTPDGSEIVY